MAAPQAPAAAAAAVSTILLPPLPKSARPISFAGLSSLKKPALVRGGSWRWRFLSRRPVPLRVGVSRQSKMREMVGTPDVFVSGDGGEGEGGGLEKAEAVVLRNEPLEFRLDLASEGLESTLNKLSKWIIAALFGIIILWKHDAEAMWIAIGSVVNAWSSTKLKQILNHQRPDPSLRSDPGMPSSHAQSIFYAASFVVLSSIDSLGINVLTVSIGAFTLACSSYLSWLRVSQKFHTISQVGVGAALGSAFSIAWFWSWQTFVSNAFISSVWVRIIVVLGSVAVCLAFLLYVIQHWLKDDE